MAIIIRSTGKALPKRRCPNDELPKELDTSDEWIRSHTGIGCRYLGTEEETASYLGAGACKKALENANIDPLDIPLLVTSTVTSEFKGFPSIACVMQDKVGLKNAACFDVSAACAGFLYAIDTASALMEKHNYKYAIVCGAETLAQSCDWTDRSTCVLFGDGAAAVVLEKVETSENVGIGTTITGSDGSGAMSLYLGKDGYLKMDGRAVYNFAVGIMTQVIKDLMEKENLTEDDVDYFVCHQANERILKAAASRLNLNFDKFYNTLVEYGNTSSASIPLCLADMDAEGRLKKGTTIVSAGFGAGLTWAGAVIRF